jgi:phosphatidylserine/phosphatidylglycerophosphate/cardiolipin synthase-like enzyme
MVREFACQGVLFVHQPAVPADTSAPDVLAVKSMRKRFATALAAAAVLIVSSFGDPSSAAPAAAAVAPRTSRDARTSRDTVSPASVRVSSPRLQVLFSPDGGCTEAIVDALGKARTSLDVQAYSFTSAPIAEAVAKAFARGVRVRIVLDKSQRSERYTSATYLANHNVPTWIDAKHAIAHNKVILVDGRTIFTGSFNFTKSADQKNAENLLIIEGDSKLFAQYLANFEEHLAHSEKYDGLGKPASGSKTVDEDGFGDAGNDTAATKAKPSSASPANRPASKRTRKAA